MMTVDEAVPECVVRIAVFLAIGHPRRCLSWASRGRRAADGDRSGCGEALRAW